MIRFLSQCWGPLWGGTLINARFFAEATGGAGAGGDAGGDGGGEGAPEGHWTGEHAYFKNNPEAVKSFAKYKTADDAWKGAHEAIKRFGEPFHLPEEGTKLSKDQQAKLTASVRKLNGVPEDPDGYEIAVPEGAPVDEQGITDWKAFAHEHGLPPAVAQKAVEFQLAFVDRLNKARGKVIEGMTNANYKAFLNEDCGGDKELAAQKLEQVKQFLQQQFTKDGVIDTAGWEKFAARIYHGDRIIELPLLRALSQAAQMAVGTGGAPGSFGTATMKAGALSYGEMDRK